MKKQADVAEGGANGAKSAEEQQLKARILPPLTAVLRQLHLQLPYFYLLGASWIPVWGLR